MLVGLAFVLVVGAVFSQSARGADYLIDVWDRENNLPDSSVTAIAQTPDGYLFLHNLIPL